MDLFNTTSKIEEKLVFTATQRNIPLGGAFELLPLCNMDCRMCFLRLSPAEMRAQGRLRTVEEWLALAEEAKEAGLLFLLLTGGEIFLYPDFKRLYEGLYQMGFFITLNTNGTLITEELAAFLADHLPRRVNITLYGASNESYNRLCGNPHGFDQTMRGIRLLMAHKVPVKLNGSLTAYNKEDLTALQEIAAELSIPIEIDSYMFPACRKGFCDFDHASRLTPQEAADAFWQIKRKELDEGTYRAMLANMALAYETTKAVDEGIYAGDQAAALALASASGRSGALKASPADSTPPEPGFEEIPCRAGKSSFWINWKGNMTPCVFMEEPALPVFETGFSAAWEKINQKRQQIFMPAACSKCERRAFCTVCAASACTETGSFLKKPHYQCAVTNEKIHLANKYWKEINP